MKNKLNENKIVMDFISAVCPEAPNLYAASFNELKCLSDATELIKHLQQRLATVEAELSRYKDGVRCPNCDTLTLKLGTAEAELEKTKAAKSRCVDQIEALYLTVSTVEAARDEWNRLADSWAAEIERLQAALQKIAAEVDVLLTDVRRLVEAAQSITNTCDFMGRSHITTDKVENLKKAIAAVERHFVSEGGDPSEEKNNLLG